MSSVNLEIPARALAIGAHPDDIEFGCGGTLAKWAANGCEIFHLVCTDGSKGTWDPSQDPTELVALRQHEQQRAANTLGSKSDVVFLGWPDGELESGLRQRWQVTAWIRRIKPDVIFGHDPWKRYRLHPDHRHAGLLTTEGIVAARDPLFFPETDAPPHRPSALLLFEADEVDHLEDVSDYLDVKIGALLEHKSQLHSTMDIATGEHDEIREFEDRTRARATEAGASEGLAFAEAFKLMDRL